jgi:hypothetical protein
MASRGSIELFSPAAGSLCFAADIARLNLPDQERIAYPDAVREALERYHDDSATSDLLLLMAWENRPMSNLGTVLRIAQIRRANPVLAAELRTSRDRRWHPS